MRTLLAIALWLVLSTTAHAGWWSLGTNLNATLISGVVSAYNGTDARGVDEYLIHSWKVGQPFNTWGSNTLVVPLVSPLSFQANVPYYAWVKALSYGDGSGDGTMAIYMGNSGLVTNVMGIDNDDASDRYLRIGPITSTILSTNFGAAFWVTNMDASLEAKFLLENIYITTSSNESVIENGYDVIQTFNAPSSVSSDVVYSGNLVPASSFEQGPLSQGWTMYNQSSESRQYSVEEMWDSTTADHGKYSLVSRSKDAIFSPIIPILHTNKLHHLTFSSQTDSIAIDMNRPQVTIYNIHPIPTGLGYTIVTNSYQFTYTLTTTNWTRFTNTSLISLWGYPYGYYQIKLETHVKATNVTAGVLPALRYDSIALFEGSNAVPYSTMFPIEIGLGTDVSGRVFLQGDTKRVNVYAYNATASSSNIVCDYYIYDARGRLVQSGTPTFTFSPGNSTNTIDLTFTNLGPYRMLLWGNNPDADEMPFTFVATDGDTGKNTNDFIGIHSNPTEYACEFWKKLGFTWVRGLSPASLFRWASTEASSNNYVWPTNRVVTFWTNQMEILATMNNGTSGGSDVPTWASAISNPPPGGYYSNWVYAAVSAWKNHIKYWEFWNEPQTGFSTTAGRTNYASIFQDAVFAADPTAGIVVFGGVNSVAQGDLLWDALSPTQQARTHAMSMHKYVPESTLSTGPNRFDDSGLGEWRVYRDTPQSITNVWDSETGIQDLGGARRGNDGEFFLYGETPLPFLRNKRFLDVAFINSINNYIHAIRVTGLGMKHFFYDVRDNSDQAQGQNLTTTHTGMESNGGIKPKTFYMVMLNQKLKGMTPGYIGFTNQNNTAVECYRFHNAGTNFVAIINTDYASRFLTLSETNFIQFDSEWNEVIRPNLAQVYLDHYPTFLWTTALTTNQLVSAVKTATVTDVSDSQVPYASIDQSPKGLVDTNFPIVIRYSGQDETSTPNAARANPTNLLFQIQIVGRDIGYSDWTAETLQTVSLATLSTNVPYNLRVRCADAAGNISDSITGPTFFLTVGGGAVIPPIVISGGNLKGAVNLRTL